MPVPEWKREASRKKRQRVCTVCGAEFMVTKVGHTGFTCSKPCLSKRLSEKHTGKVASPESRAKISAALKAVRSDPERNAKWNAAAHEGIKRYLADPDNLAAFSARASERMRQRHADPEFQKRRNERSSRTMKETWTKYREKFTQIAIDKYARGEGLNSEEGKANKVKATKWIMKKAQEALRTQTDYEARFAEIQAQLRREMPYDGPLGTSDYYDYLQKLGKAVANHPELRKMADDFLSEAIPHFAQIWNETKGAAK